MFYAKTFKAGKDTVLAMCDEDLMGTTIKTEELELKITNHFYGESKIDDESKALDMMENCTIGNLIGKRIVALAEEHGFITKENIISIGGVRHAQFVKI